MAAMMRQRLARIGMALVLATVISGCRPQDSEDAEREVGEAIESVTEAGEAAGAAARQALDQAGDAGARQAAVTEARTKLAALRARAQASEEAADVADGVERVRRDLAAAYENADGEAADWWRDVQPELEALEQDVREGTADSLDRFSSTLERLEREVRY